MRTPEFWSRDTGLARALSPLGQFYEMMAGQRRDNAPYRAPVPVICIGNVTAGGSGKTPAALALGKIAVQRGIDVHFLSRGYGGSLRGSVRVDPARHTAADVGDEPLLLSRVAPAWVARDRPAGLRAATDAGAGLVIMDDGLQNPHVVKDAALLVVDGGFGFGNGLCLPAGPLREPVAKALARVDAVLLVGDDKTGACSLLPPGFPVIRARLHAMPHDLKGRRIIAFAGIGRPEKFRETLRNEGIETAGWFAFGDHHRFTSRELDFLLRQAKEKQALLITTEKDYFRLPGSMRAHVRPFGVELAAEDPAALVHFIDKAMACRNRA